MADAATTTGSQTLEAQLEEMLEIERFDPPQDFVKDALLSDPAVYEEAETRLEGMVVAAGQRASLVQGAV